MCKLRKVDDDFREIGDFMFHAGFKLIFTFEINHLAEKIALVDLLFILLFLSSNFNIMREKKQ